MAPAHDAPVAEVHVLKPTGRVLIDDLVGGNTAHMLELATEIGYAFLVDHYALPPEHWAVCRALESILCRDEQKG